MITNLLFTDHRNSWHTRFVRYNRNLYRKTKWRSAKTSFNRSRVSRQSASYFFWWAYHGTRLFFRISMLVTTKAIVWKWKNNNLHDPPGVSVILPANRPHLCNRRWSMYLPRFLRELSAIFEWAEPRVPRISQSSRFSTWDIVTRLRLSKRKPYRKNSRRKKPKL